MADNVQKAQDKQAKYYNLKWRHVEYPERDSIWISAHLLSDASQKFIKLAPKWTGPCMIKKVGPMNYKVEFPDGNIDNINVVNLKMVMFPISPSCGGRGLRNAAT